MKENSKKGIILGLFFILLASFITAPTIKVSKNASQEKKEAISIESKKILVVEFYVTQNGCTYQVFIVFETNNGNGSGWIRRTCPGLPSQTVYFNIYGAVVARSATTEHLGNFRNEDETPASLTEDEKQLIVDGMNDNEEWDGE